MLAMDIAFADLIHNHGGLLKVPPRGLRIQREVRCLADEANAIHQ